MEFIQVKINNVPVSVPKGSTVLEAAKYANINIPTLCYLKDCTQSGACRVCVVEVKNARSLVASCVYPTSEGMEILVNSKRAVDARRNTVELLLSNHSKDCLTCVRNQTCELQSLADTVGADAMRFTGAKTKPSFDDLSDGIVRDTSKCVLCGRCVNVCNQQQGLGILGYQGRGFETKVAPILDQSLKDVNCIQCGQCVISCPVGALSEKREVHDVISALNDPNTFVVVQTAPAIRASLGEEFGMPIGTRVTGKMAQALKMMGFDRVYDTNFAADLTIMEEGYEFLHRFSNQINLPMITSCSPGWVNYIEGEYSELLGHLSSCKSPHMMLGSIVKTHFAQKNKLDPKQIYVVSIMPCTAKKGEKNRPETYVDGLKNIDAVLTTRELGDMIKMYGIDFTALPDAGFDEDLYGEYTGAGVIFGVTGGVMEAALRTVYEKVTNETLENVNFSVCRGFAGVKEASLDLNGLKVNVAIAHSMQHAKPLLEQIKAGTSPYHFIEIMGCPGGCINGGGQSIVPARIKNLGVDYKQLRANALYEEDERLVTRKSHDNTQIQALYTEFLGEPNSHLAHEILHTHYNKKDRFRF
ncbi:MAG: NADH-dependent [FeFe] hydrogenase, group A6 [Erysipelotrichaceae bacterium]